MRKKSAEIKEKKKNKEQKLEHEKELTRRRNIKIFYEHNKNHKKKY